MAHGSQVLVLRSFRRGLRSVPAPLTLAHLQSQHVGDLCRDLPSLSPDSLQREQISLFRAEANEEGPRTHCVSRQASLALQARPIASAENHGRELPSLIISPKSDPKLFAVCGFQVFDAPMWQNAAVAKLSD